MAKKRIITNPKFMVERDGDNWVLKFKDGKIYKTVEFLNAQNSGNKNGVITNPNFSIIEINVYVNINGRNVKVGEVGDNYTLESKMGNVIDEPNLDAVITSNGNIIIGVDINGKHVALNDDFSKTMIQYKATTKPTSTWISTNCIRNKFANGRGELVLKNGVTTLVGRYDDDNDIHYTIFKDIDYNPEVEDNNISEVIIPSGITEIGDYAFYYYTALTSVTIPNSITSIVNCTFSGCTRLTSIYIPDSVISIGEDAFSDCSGLTSITIPDSVTSIGEGTFDGCANLSTVTCLATTPPTLGTYAFASIGSSPVCNVPSDSLSLYEDPQYGWDVYGFTFQAIS